MSAPTLAAPEKLIAAGVTDMTELARLACAQYEIAPDARLHLFPLTENWTYRIESSGAAATVLRIYRPGGRSTAEVMSELAWMRALGEDVGSLVPAVIPTSGGQPGARADPRAAAAAVLLRDVQLRSRRRAG